MLASCWEQANNRVAETSIRALVALLNQFSCIDRRNYRVSSHGVVSPRRALLSLIEERGYDALSIQDITERANIGRATFYIHYQDKEQLLLDSVNAVMEDLKSHYQSASAIDIFMKRQTFSVALFQHVFEHASLYRALLSERGAALMITRLQREVAARMQEQVIEPLLALATVKLPADLLAEHCAASLWSLVAWWLRNDFPTSIEEMGQIFWHLINQGLLQTLGVLEQEKREE
jgi:AcrR family transcriptional regulator